MIVWNVNRRSGRTGSVEPTALPVLVSMAVGLVIGVRRIPGRRCMLPESCFVFRLVGNSCDDHSSRLVPRQPSKFVRQRQLILKYESIVDLSIMSL